MDVNNMVLAEYTCPEQVILTVKQRLEKFTNLFKGMPGSYQQLPDPASSNYIQEALRAAFIHLSSHPPHIICWLQPGVSLSDLAEKDILPAFIRDATRTNVPFLKAIFHKPISGITPKDLQDVCHAHGIHPIHASTILTALVIKSVVDNDPCIVSLSRVPHNPRPPIPLDIQELSLADAIAKYGVNCRLVHPAT